MAAPRSTSQESVSEVPALSVILVIGGQREREARALQSLLEQSAIDRMEILLYDLGPVDCPPIPGSDHPRVRLTRQTPDDLLAVARADGIRAARAPVICFMEEHCEMQPGTAEVFIRAHEGPWTAVGGDFINGNPDSVHSNQAFRMNYGIYVRPQVRGGPAHFVPGQNSAFKRDVLLRYDDKLEMLLNADLVLQRLMARDGCRFLYEPAAKIAHRNENTFRSLATGIFYWNWCFSHVRAKLFRLERGASNSLDFAHATDPVVARPRKFCVTCRGLGFPPSSGFSPTCHFLLPPPIAPPPGKLPAY